MANEFKVKKGLIVHGSGSVVLDVRGSQGQLFSVTDNLSGSLFSVADISGVPVFDVFSSGKVGIGTSSPAEKLHVYGGNVLISGSSANTTLKLQDGANGAQITLQSNGSSEAFIFIGNENSSIRRTGGDLNFLANNIDMMFSTNNGSTSTLFLDTSHNATFAGNVSLASGKELTINNNASNNNNGIHIKNDTDAYSGALTFHTEYSGTDTNVARIQGGTNGSNGILYLQTANTSKTLTTALSLDFNQAAVFNGNVSIGSDTNEKDFIVYGNDTGERLFWDGSESKLKITHDTDDFGLSIFTVGGVQMTQPQIKIGRDINQYWGVYTEDRNAHLVHRQDETSGIMTTRFDQWDSNTSDNTGKWLFRSGNGTGGSMTTALELNQAGDAIFSGGGEFHSSVHLDSDSAQLQFGDGNTMQIFHNGANGEINNATGDFTIDSAGDIILDAGGADIFLKDDETEFGLLANTSNNLVIMSRVENKDIIFKGNDGGSTITPVTIDMSEGGRVGIGTTVPDTLLHISSSNFNDHITLARDANKLGITVSGTQLLFEGGVSPFSNINEDLGRSDKHWNEIYVYSVRSGGVLQFKTNGDNEKMRILSDGKVGIATTNPTSQLTVKSNSASSADSGISIQANGSTDDIIKLAEKSTNGGRLHMYDGGTEKIALYTDGTDNHITPGNLGIGTSGPNAKLFIEDSQTFAMNRGSASTSLLGLHNTNNGAGAGIIFTDQGNDYVTDANQKGSLTFFHADGSSHGGGASFKFRSTEDDLVLAVGDADATHGRIVVWSGGNAAEVDYGFAQDVDTGMRRTSANNVSLMAGGIAGVSVGMTASSMKYSGSAKIITANDGVDITGNVDADTAVFDGGSSTTATPLTLGSSTQTDYTLQLFKTSAHGTNNAYLIAYGAGHGSQAGNFAIKNTLSGKNVHFEVDGGTRLTIEDNEVTVANNLRVNGGSFYLTNQSSSPTITFLHDGANPSTNDLLHNLNFQVDYNGAHQEWGGIDHQTNSSAVRTDLIFKVKSTSGNVETGLKIQGQPSATPNSIFYGQVLPSGNGAKDLGGTSNRWATVYANDFNSAVGSTSTFGGDIKLDDHIDHSPKIIFANQNNEQYELFLNSADKFKVTDGGAERLELYNDGTNTVLNIKSKGALSFDTNGRQYNWKAVSNTSSDTVNYVKIAEVFAGQSTRLLIELVGRKQGYGDGELPAMGYILGQSNNDNNWDYVFYNHDGVHSNAQVIEEAGIVGIGTNRSAVWVKVNAFSEVSAHAHASDGTLEIRSDNSGSSAPSGYAAMSTIQVWNSANDGAGSGLNADLLDGQHGSYYASATDVVTLSGNQTISGAKNFTSVSNQFNGHLYFNAYDSQGNHYPHFRDGSAGNGANINIRHYYGSAAYKVHVISSDSSGNMQFDFQGTYKGDALTIDGSSNLNGDVVLDNSGTGDRTLTISTTTGGDPTIVLNSDAANRSGLIRYQDNGTNIGRIEYVHNGDKLEFQAGSATGASLTLTNNTASMVSGNATAKFAVKSAGPHPSYDFYNNGTSYFNGSVVVDASITQTGTTADSIVASFAHTAFDSRQVGMPGRFMVGPLGNGYPSIGYNFTTSDDVYTKIANDTAWGIHFGVSNKMSFLYKAAGTGTFTWDERMSIDTSGNVTINPGNLTISAGNLTASSGTGHFSLVNASAYQLNGTYIVDSSRNLVNIGTITASGKISSPQRKYFSVSIGNSYVRLARLEAASGQLAVAYRISGTSHGTNHVGNFTADILVNHSQDVLIRSMTGGYTQGTLKVESDNNEDHTLSFKSNTSDSPTYHFTLELLGSEATITTLPSSTAATNTSHEHVLNFGTNISGTGGTVANKFTGGVLHVGNTSSTANYVQVQGSSSEDTYTVFEGKRKYPRIRLIDSSNNNHTYNIWNLGSQLRFGTSGGSSSNASFYINGSGAADVIFNGEVGIGTTDPAEKLHVDGSIRLGSMKLQNISAGGRIGFNRNTADGTIYNSSYEAFQIQSNGSGYLETQAYNSSGAFQGSMVFTTAARMGLGTSSPNHKLDIQVDENVGLRLHRFNSALDTTEPIGIGFSHRSDTANSTTDTRAGIFSSYNGDLFFSVDQGGRVDDDPIADAAMFIDGAAGKIGIGTITPTANLEIAGAGAQLRVGPRYSSGGDRDFVDLIANGTDSKVKSDNERFHIENSLGHIILSPNDKVGIGTTSPARTLDIVGNLGLTGDIVGTGSDIFLLHSAGPQMFMRRSDTSISTDDRIGALLFQGDDPTDGVYDTGASITAKASTNWSSNNNDTRLEFAVKNNASLATALTILHTKEVIAAHSLGVNVTSINSTQNHGLQIANKNIAISGASGTGRIRFAESTNGLTNLYSSAGSGQLFAQTSKTAYGQTGQGNGTVALTNETQTTATGIAIKNTSTGNTSTLFSIFRTNNTGTSNVFSGGNGSPTTLLKMTGRADMTVGYSTSFSAVRAENFYSYGGGTTYYLKLNSTTTSLNARGDVIAFASSDIRMKEDIRPLENSLDKLDKIKGVKFKWNDIHKDFKGKEDIGVIAQDVEKVLPEIVTTRDTGYKAVDYQKLSVLLIESVKELKKEVEELKSKINK